MDDKKRSCNMDMVDKYCQWMKSMGMQGVMVSQNENENENCMSFISYFTFRISFFWIHFLRSMEWLVKACAWQWRNECEWLKNGTNALANTAWKWWSTLAEWICRAFIWWPNMLKNCKSIASWWCPIYSINQWLKKIWWCTWKMSCAIVQHVQWCITTFQWWPAFTVSIHNFGCENKNSRSKLWILRMFDSAVDMMRWIKMMDKECPMFCGLYWCHDHMDMMMMLKQKMPHMNYICATMSSMMGWMSQGKIAWPIFDDTWIVLIHIFWAQSKISLIKFCCIP